MRRRTKARECIIQILYQYDITNDPIDKILDQFWKDKNHSPLIKNFAIEIVKGTIDKLAEIDSLISEYSENWTIDRMPVVDRNILRFSIYELLYRDDIPPRVTIDESIDLSNKFSTPNSGKFVNGILDKIMYLCEKKVKLSCKKA